MSQTPEEAASTAAPAGPWQHSSLRNARRSPSPYGRKTPGSDKSGDKSGRRRSATPGAAKGGRNDGLCFYHSATRPTSARRAALTRKTNRPVAGPQFAAAAGPIPACRPPSVAIPELVTAMSAFPTKNLIFFEGFKRQLKLFSQLWASISILPYSSSAPPTGPHLVGANVNTVPVWGRRRQIVSFAGHDFEFNFFLAAVATPIIGMDFLTKFELSIIPAKRQVLHAASGCTLTQASTSSFVSPWSPETAAAVAALRPQVQKLLEEFLSLLRPSATPPKPLHGVVHHIDTGSAAPVFARPRRLDPEKHRIAE
jgi:hypothetical protein